MKDDKRIYPDDVNEGINDRSIGTIHVVNSYKDILNQALPLWRYVRNSRPSRGNRNMFHVHKWDSSDFF